MLYGYPYDGCHCLRLPPAKAASNAAKHDVTFEEAIVALEDPMADIEPDDSNPGEQRWRTIGISAQRILFVITAEPDDYTVRIISARKVNRREQERYYRNALS